MRKQFYLDLVSRLKTGVVTIEIVDEEEIRTPKILHFDLWNQQLEFLQKEKPFKFPAVFVEFMPLEWRQLGIQAQEADLTFRLHIVSKYLGSTADGTGYQTEALAHLNLLDEIHYCLSGWNTSYSGPVTRIQSLTNHNHDQIVDEIEVYRMKITDTSGVKRVVEVEADPVFSAYLHKRGD